MGCSTSSVAFYKSSTRLPKLAQIEAVFLQDCTPLNKIGTRHVQNQHMAQQNHAPLLVVQKPAPLHHLQQQ